MKKKKNRKQEELREQQQREEKMKEFIEYLQYKIKERALNGHTSFYYNITKQDVFYKLNLNYYNNSGINTILNKIKIAFEKADYTVWYNIYSLSWQSKSGKVAEILIRWDK